MLEPIRFRSDLITFKLSIRYSVDLVIVLNQPVAVGVSLLMETTKALMAIMAIKSGLVAQLVRARA